MQLAYGSYLFPFNAVNIIDRREQLWNKGGQLYAYRRSFECDGWVYSDPLSIVDLQTQITLLMSGLMTALSVQGQDLILFQDNGQRSATILDNASSISGVRCEGGPDFTENIGAEYSGQRKFHFKFWAEYPYDSSRNLMLEFFESLTFGGGLPKYVVRPALNGPGQRQMTFLQMPYTCIQQGYAVGYRYYPVPPGPKFPFSLLEAPSLKKDTPERRNLNSYQGYRVEWSYNFADVAPLTTNVNPTLWV